MKDVTINTPLWDAAEKLYSVGRRAYHNFQHAVDVFKRVQLMDGHLGLQNPQAMYLAALFHDAIYTHGDLENEIKSAIAMEEAAMEHGVHSMIRHQAYALILATSHHMAPQNYTSDWDTMIFMDCDVMGFAENWDQYAKQNEDILFEANPQDMEKYNQGRKAFLTKLMDKGVFRSPYFRKTYEDRALRNITRSLKELA